MLITKDDYPPANQSAGGFHNPLHYHAKALEATIQITDTTHSIVLKRERSTTYYPDLHR